MYVSPVSVWHQSCVRLEPVSACMVFTIHFVWLHISLFGHVKNERFLFCKHDTKSSCHKGVELASFPMLTSPNLFWVDVMWKSMVYIVNGFQVNILYAQTISWFFWSDLGPVQLIFSAEWTIGMVRGWRR